MRTGLSRSVVRTAATVVIVFVCIGPAAAQKLPSSTTMGTNPAGTVFYSVASGLAKAISGAGAMQSVVQPYTGTSTFLPLLDNGEIDFGVVNAVDMSLAYQGPSAIESRRPKSFSPCPKHAPADARITVDGQPGIQKGVDHQDRLRRQRQARDRRVSGPIWRSGTASSAASASGGLTWDDVKVVPVPAVNDGIDALVQGRADVGNHAVGSAKVKEADATVGVRYVSLDCSPRVKSAYEKLFPVTI